MKRVFILLSFLLAAPCLRGQDSTAAGPSRAEMEHIKALEGKIQDAQDSNAALDRKIQALSRQLEEMRVQMSKPTGNYATRDDLKEFTEKLQEIDKKRLDDNEKIVKMLDKLRKDLIAPPGAGRSQTSRTNTPGDNSSTTTPEKKSDEGYWYTIKPNDTFKKIAQYYREQGIKVSSDEIAKANPNVQETKLMVDNKLFIPAPKPAQTPKQ